MKHDPERLQASRGMTVLRTVNHLSDELVRIPGTKIRFGLDPLIGLLPGGGDLIGGAVSAYAIVVATRMGAPAAVILRMALNILIDTVVGAIPLIGDAFDFAWKANRKNLSLLERYIDQPAGVKRSSVALLLVVLLVLAAATIGVAVFTVWLIARLLHR